MAPAARAQVKEAVAQAAKDTAISARIETLFAVNEYLSPFNINTTTVDGVVTLTGSVEDEIQKDLAEDLAKTVDGVKEVRNNLTVVGTIVSERPRKGWRESVNDMTLNAAIRGRLLYNKELKGLKIGVSTEKGVVTLHGVVNTHFQKEHIEKVVMETRGVERVINNLTVHERTPAAPIEAVTQKVSDEWVEKRVQTAVVFNRHLNIRNLNVNVDNGLCILTGTVDTEEQRELAESLALSIAGVERVQNDIQVYSPPAAPVEPPAPATN
jgi:osmotically-inducible protein OsmY